MAVSDYRLIHNPVRRTAVVRATTSIDDLQAFAEGAFRHVLSAMEAQGTLPAGEPFLLYRGFGGAAVELECGFPTFGAFVPTGDVVASELPSTRAVVGVHVGSIGTLAATCAAMGAWASAHGLTPLDCVWQVHLTDPERESDASRWQSEVWLPVA
jgi:DNA gyrase inhibitor GyrI